MRRKLLDEEDAAIRRRLSELEAEFRAAIEKRAKAVEWRSAQALPVPYILQQARAADLLVVGARSETIVDPCVAADPSDLVMQAGRPLIVVPPDRAMARFQKRAGGLEGRAGSPPGRVRCAADPRCGKGRHDRGNSRAGRPIARMRCRMSRTWRRGCAATVSWRAPSFRNRTAQRHRTTRQDRRRRRRRRGDCRGLWPLAVPRMDTQRRHASSGDRIAPLCLSVPLESHP